MKLKERLLIFILTIGCIFVFYQMKNRGGSAIKGPRPHVNKVDLINLNGESRDSPKDVKLDAVKEKSMPIKMTEEEVTAFVSSEMSRLLLDMQGAQITDIASTFNIASRWVEPRQIYPHLHQDMAAILKVMSTAKIIQADALPKGTQIKLLLVLEGGQKVVFKQRRYQRDHIITGKAYDGYDRHNAEIASFHLDRILDFRRSPLVVGRTINLKQDVIPVATERLLKTFREKDGNTCYFGICLYCNEKEMACADGDVMEGAVTLWLPDNFSTFEKQRHPYQRTYKEGRSARWENDDGYCNSVVKKTAPYNKGPRLLDVTDGAVFDYLIGNADRHHYETFKDHGPDAMILMMDNAKSFGNPNLHEASILAPLRQCCLLRNSTWTKLGRLQGGVLTQLLEAAMENDPIAPVLHPSHLNAMDVRLPTLVDTVTHCILEHGYHNVIVDEWKGL